MEEREETGGRLRTRKLTMECQLFFDAVFCQKQFLDPPPVPDWVLHVTEASVLQFLVSALVPGPSRTGLNPRIIAVGALLCFLGRKIRILQSNLSFCTPERGWRSGGSCCLCL